MISFPGAKSKVPCSSAEGVVIAFLMAVSAEPVNAQSWSLFVIAPGLSVTLEVRESS